MSSKTSDVWVALSVVFSSLVLLAALSLGLSGWSFGSGDIVRVRFHDVTGIKTSSGVKFAGAPAGRVTGLRILTSAERQSDPQHLIEMELRLSSAVPALSKNAQISIAADTLLSDKFVLVSDVGGASALGEQDYLAGITPVTFDQLTRELEAVMSSLQTLMEGKTGERSGEVFEHVISMLTEAQGLLVELKPAVSDARTLIGETRMAAGEARVLIADGQTHLKPTFAKLETAATAFESFARRGESIVRTNEPLFSRTLADFKITAENLRITSTYSKFLLRGLAQSPSRILWGRGPVPDLPSESDIRNARGSLGLPESER